MIRRGSAEAGPLHAQRANHAVGDKHLPNRLIVRTAKSDLYHYQQLYPSYHLRYP